MASMFDTIADMLRGSAPDDLAHALGTDRTQTRRAMEIGLPALITGLRDKTLEPGGALNLASMLDEPTASVSGDLDTYLAAGDPSQGAAMLDVAFGDRGEPALAALSSASGLSTRLLAQVMSVLAPLATGVVADVSDRSPGGLRTYLAGAVEDLEGKGFGRVVELVSPALPDGAATSMFNDGDVDYDSFAPDQAEAEVDDSFDDDFSFDNSANVVEGAFPGTADGDDAFAFDDLAPIELDDEISALDLAGDMPSFEADLASVAPAGVSIAGDVDMDLAAPVATPAALAVADRAPDIDADLNLEGKGLSSMGWLWWLIGAILGLVILLFAISQCGGSDGDDLSTGSETVEQATPTPDPAVIARQASLDAILVEYPNVQGEVVGDVAVLRGTVATETDRALLDQAVRRSIPSVQNNVTSTEATAPAQDGYSLNDLIDAQPELSTLRALLDQAGLGDALDSGADFTLFAPTNDAFAAISDQVAELQADPTKLQEVLLYHVLRGSQDGAAISAAAALDTNLEGQTIAVNAESGGVVLNGSAEVIVADAQARNGLMHIVNGVLLPQTAVAFPEEIGAALGLAPITFSAGSSNLTDAGKVELDKVVTFLLATPGNIEIGGHTDADGDTGFNQTLSQERADAVKAYMSSQGIPAESMIAIGFGEAQPIAPNDTADGKAKNRRIEFRPNN